MQSSLHYLILVIALSSQSFENKEFEFAAIFLSPVDAVLVSLSLQSLIDSLRSPAPSKLENKEFEFNEIEIAGVSSLRLICVCAGYASRVSVRTGRLGYAISSHARKCRRNEMDKGKYAGVVERLQKRATGESDESFFGED